MQSLISWFLLLSWYLRADYIRKRCNALKEGQGLICCDYLQFRTIFTMSLLSMNPPGWSCLFYTHTHTMPVCTEHPLFWGPCVLTAGTRVPWFIPYLFKHERKTNSRHVSITLKSVLYHFKSRDPVNTRSTSAAQSCPCRHILCHLWWVHGEEKRKAKKERKFKSILITINQMVL